MYHRVIVSTALGALALGLAGCGSPTPTPTPTPVTQCTDGNCATEAMSFVIPKAPSGLFYDSTTSLLHVLCGTDTNCYPSQMTECTQRYTTPQSHWLYMFGTDGTQHCEIEIPPTLVNMTRVDGFWIEGSLAYIVDSQGPVYGEPTHAGGSLYEVEWASHPCGCADGACTSTALQWSPTLVRSWKIGATESGFEDGNNIDLYYRNSGVLINGDFFYSVNGVHPVVDLYTNYPKSIAKFDMTTAVEVADGWAQATQSWNYDNTSLGHHIDMEGLTYGPEGVGDIIYVGDEWEYVYKLDLGQTAAADTVVAEWYVKDITGDTPRNSDDGIESITYDGEYFYIGIQGTLTVHKITLTEASKGSKVVV